MTNVLQLWRNVGIVGVTAVLLFPFVDEASWVWFPVGIAYSYLFEYFYHRFVGHSDRFPVAAKKHREHHRIWRGFSALTADRYQLDLSEDWYFFPAALTLHFVVGKLLGFFPFELLLAFVLFYIQFEVFHWATHIVDNCIDEWLLEWSLIRGIRLRQIDWHLHHHEMPRENYNFTVPYPGDKVFRTGRGSYWRKKTWDFQ